MKSAPLNYSAWAKEVFNKRNYLVILFVGLFPPLFGTLTYWLGVNQDLSGSYQWEPIDGLLNLLYSFLVTAVMVFSATGTIAVLNQILPWKGNISMRVVTEVVALLLLSLVAQSLILYSLEGTRVIYQGRALVFTDYVRNVIFTTTITLIAAAILEGSYFFKNWRQSLLAEERLAKEHAQSQLTNLRSQLDPHFMFNSLNVLSALIRKNPATAEEFVEKFALVYRYLLEVRNEVVVPLRDEWAFVQNYLDLQQIRFKEGLRVNSQIDPAYLNYYLPPLSLQELVSNAIKHNAIDRQKPLMLEIITKNEGIEVRNSLNLRQGTPTSTGVGLKNIKERYALLSTQNPEFSITDKAYIARLPLLQAEA